MKDFYEKWLINIEKNKNIIFIILIKFLNFYYILDNICYLFILDNKIIQMGTFKSFNPKILVNG